MQFALLMVAVAALPTMESEGLAALAHVRTLPAEDQPFYRYISTYSVDEGFIAKGRTERVVSFWLNSLSSKLTIKRPRQASDTLLYFDLRDYGISQQDWNVFAAEDPYYPGGIVTRADFFVAHTSDATRSQSYYTLLYGKGKEPKTLQNVLDTWKVRQADARAIGVETGAVIEAGVSMVARHNRILSRVRTVTGAFHTTFDVKNNIGPRDAIENLSNLKFDASESIGSLPNSLHYYFLNDAKGVKQDTAPVDIAIDRISDPNSVEVKTARSCVICHSLSDGLHAPRNALPELLDSGVLLKTKDKALAEFIERFYLSDDGDEFRADQRAYAKAIHKANGWTPAENGKAFQALIIDYESNVTTEQAAREFGLTVEEFKQCAAAVIAVAADGDDANGRVAGLAVGRPCPRDAWEATVYDKIHAILGAQK